MDRKRKRITDRKKQKKSQKLDLDANDNSFGSKVDKTTGLAYPSSTIPMEGGVHCPNYAGTCRFAEFKFRFLVIIV